MSPHYMTNSNMISIHQFRFPDTVFNSVGRVVALNSNHGVIEFHIGELSAVFALFYLDHFYIDNRATSDINEVYNCLRNNLHVHFDANHILFHPSLKNETKELPNILNFLYITSKVWVGLRPSMKNEQQPILNAVNVLKTILPCVFKISTAEKFNYNYDLKSSDLDHLQISLSDAVSYVVEIVNNESGVLKISANNLFTYAIFNINILYIDGIKCDSSKLLKEFVTAGMKLHCNAKRINNTFGNYVVTCVWSGRKPTALDVFNNIVPHYTNDLKLICNIVYVGIVLQLHPPDFALLATSDSQHVSYVILYIGNFRLSETQLSVHKGSWIDDFLDLSDILFFKVDSKQNGDFSFASDAWFPDILEINGYTYMVFDDMNLRKSLSWIDKEYNRITKHIFQMTNVKSCKVSEHLSRKLHRRINKPIPKCVKLPPISENEETIENFSSPTIGYKAMNTNLVIRPTICNDKFQVESQSDSEIGSSSNLEAHENSMGESNDDCGNCIKINVHKTNYLEVTEEVTPLSNNMFCRKESNSKQSSDLLTSTSHTRNVNKSDKSISSELISKQLFTNYKQAVLVNQQSQYNSTTHEPLSVKKLNSQENHYNDFEKNSMNDKHIICRKKVRFNIDSSENNETNTLVLHSTANINEPSCDFKNCKHSKPGHKHFTLSCGTFSSNTPNTGHLLIQPNLKIIFDINVLYKCGKPCDVRSKLLDHITIGQKLNYIVSTLDTDKHVPWGVWYGPDVPDDIIFIKSLLLLPNEKLKILANNALYYATVVKLSPPIGALLVVQNQRQLIPVVLLAENLNYDDSGHQTVNCMMDHLLVGDSVEVKVKKKLLHCLPNDYIYWEAAEAWKRMPYASELFKRKTVALKGPYYLHSLEDSKKKRKKIFKKEHNSSKLGDPQSEISKQVIISENEDNFSEGFSDLEKPFNVRQNKTEDEVFNSTDNEKIIDNKVGTQVDIESVHKTNDSVIVIGQMQSKVLSVPGATNKNTPEIQSLTKVTGIVESVCCWYAIIMFQYCENTERAICYKNSIALQTYSPLEQYLRVGMSVAFSIEHMKEPNMGSNYRAINVCIVSSLNEGNPVETHYNKHEISHKNQDSKSVSRYLESNHKTFTYLRNHPGVVKYILSDIEGVIECEIRGICLHLRFKNDVFQPQHNKDTNLNRYLRNGQEVSFDATLLNHEEMSNSNVKIISIWKRSNLREDIFYKAKVVELRLPFAFVAQVYEEKIFVFNRYFRSEGEGSIKLAANQPIKNYVSIGSEVKVIVQRNKPQTSDKLYQFAWTAKDCWLLKK